MSQRFKFYLPFFILLFGIGCKTKPGDVIADVNKHYKEINSKLSDYKKKRVDDITNKGGGYITGYYSDKEVKKVIAEHFFDTARTFTEYYFDDGFLIYIMNNSYLYNRPQSFTEAKALALGDSVWYDDKKTKLAVSRYYFNKNHLVKWMDTTGTDVAPASERFVRTEPILLAEAQILLLELKEQ